MIRLTLADGTRIHVNPAVISYIQPLPETDAAASKEQPKTKVVLVSGETFSVRQPQNQILAATGVERKRRKKHEGEDEGETEASDE